MDPHKLTATADENFQHTIYSALTRWDTEMMPQPEVAESWDNPDPTTWIFTVRQGMKFHNGREVTAEDVKFSIDRIKELGESGAYASYITEVESVEVLEDNQVQFNLRAPSAPLLNNLAMCAIVPPEAAEGENLSKNPVGAGPFKFVERIPNQHVKLEKNPDYWQTDLDLVDELVFVPAVEAQTAVANLQTGGLSYLSTVPFNLISEVEPVENLELVEPQPGSGSFAWTLMNNTRPPFDNREARLAVSYAIDRAAILDAVMHGRGESHWNIFPQNHWVYADDIEGPAYDVEQAKQYLESSTYNGEELIYKIFPLSYYPQLSQLIQAMLMEVGFNIKLEQVEFATYIEQVYQQEDFTIAQTGLTQEWDPDTFCRTALYTGGGDSPGGYSSEEMDAAIDAGSRATSRDERIEAYREVQRIYAEDQPHIKVVSVNSVGAIDTTKIQSLTKMPSGLPHWEKVVAKS